MPEMTPLEARLTQEVAALRAENLRQAQENKLLREKIDLLVRRVFGASSEKLDVNQLMLGLEAAEAKKPEASSDAHVALEAEEERNSKSARRRKKKGGVTDALLDSLPPAKRLVGPWTQLRTDIAQFFAE